jgi:signal transduction histidine kinase
LISLTKIIGASSASSLEFKDASNGREILRTLATDTRILSAALYTPEGRLFTHFRRSDPDNELVIPPKPLGEGTYFQKGYLILSRKIGDPNHPAGCIYIQAELRGFFDLLQQYGAVIAAVFGGSCLLSFLLSSRLQSRVSKPILHLAETAKKVSDENDYTLRAIKKSDDELGFCIDQFNEMLDQIRKRDVALSKTKGELNERVKERTRDLEMEINVRKRTESAIIGQNLVLEKLARGESLKEILDMITTNVERLLPATKCGILLLDSSGTRLFYVSAPGLPSSFTEKINGFTIGPNAGTCGAAISTAKLTVSEDIETDPLWVESKDLALSHGLRACWSSPIKGAEGAILGTFALFYGVPKRPTATEIKLIQSTAYLAGIAIENKTTNEKLKSYAANLERSNQSLQDFASIASHDLQEPLRKIITFGDRLRSKLSDVDEQGIDYMERMQKAAQRMQGFIDDLLLYSRVSSKSKALESVDFREMISQVIEDLDIRISQTRGAVVVEDLPVLQADLFQMRQLFQNLIGNALKYHRDQVPPNIVVHSSSKNNGFWEIIVEDNGIGFDEKYKERIFKPFERLHGRSAFEGSGMGLAICKKIVDLHGGDIAVESIPEKGTTFKITLPEAPI